MSDWGGPYVAVMLPISATVGDPIKPMATDAGTLYRIEGVSSIARVPRLGVLVEVNLLILLFAGSRKGRAELIVSMTRPDNSTFVAEPIAFEYRTDELAPSRLTLPIKLEVTDFGTYWFRAQIGQRVLSRVPIRIEQASDVPDAFLRAWE